MAQIKFYRWAFILFLSIACGQQIGCKSKSTEAYDRGVEFGIKGDYDSAIRDFDKAIELDPKLAVAYSNRAVAHLSKKDHDKAWLDVKKCQELGIKVDPEFLKILRTHSGKTGPNHKYPPRFTQFF
jgi:tetratricopeptide (TPR) repeat protein